MNQPRPARLVAMFGLLAAVVAGSCAAPLKIGQLLLFDRDRSLRQRNADTPVNSPDRPGILFLAFDGVDRSLIYDMLRKGELPNLAALLGGGGGDKGDFPHAYFSDELLSTMPSSTLAAWSTVTTGLTPAEHGVAGNEFFIRENRRLAAPAPVSFKDSTPTLEVYTDDYVNKIIKVPTVYERMRDHDPNILIWVAVHQVYRGADRLLVAPPTVLAEAFEDLFQETLEKGIDQSKPTRTTYEKLDHDVVSEVDGALDNGPLPDVLTIYLPGTDLYAHVATEGPNDARRTYLTDVIEPSLGELLKKLRERNALANRYVVLTSDHGHTQVRYDDQHAMSAKGGSGPVPSLMKKAGYRVRPFKLDVSQQDDFNAVLAEGGATAYVYVANRATCPNPKDVCDWREPPRYEEDVLPMADAFYKNNQDGSLEHTIQGNIDLVLTRRPKPFAEVDLPFEVYVGNGKTVPIGEYLEAHPHTTYIATEKRLHDLAVGPHGERAGDVMLIAHNGDRADRDERYYFASLYRSWHGSPSRQDSEIPFIVAHPTETAAALKARVEKILGPEPRQQKVSDVLLDLREGAK